MNRKVLILRSILEDPGMTQRELCRTCGTALGTVNTELRQLLGGGLAEKTETGYRVTEKGQEYLKPYRVDAAVIMAAGFGSRFVPLTLETPKGLLQVFGEPMIERQIGQLHEAGITDITIIVGYMKEKFEYLIDKYGVKLRYNPEFTDKNTLASLYHAADVLEGKNAYILSSDNWMRENLYHAYEPDAWYAAAHAAGPTSEWVLESDAKGRITGTYPGGKGCDYMYGPVYFTREFSENFLPVLRMYYQMPGTEDFYWEHVLMELFSGLAAKRLLAYFGKTPEVQAARKPEMYVNRQPDGVIYEFENLEELRRFDKKYVNDSGSEAMQLVSRVFGVPESEIRKIRCLKAGMTNNSWLFSIGEDSYICRIPGEGTEKLIDRRQEKAVYEAVAPLAITEELIYFDAETGYKISRFYENSRNAKAGDEADMQTCMKILRRMHESGVKVEHSFDIAERIRYYEDLIGGDVPFRDYAEVSAMKEKILSWLLKKGRKKVLAHVDSVADNFIFLPGADLSERDRDETKVKLIDWEYAGMADPLIDVAMCAIYSYYSEEKMRKLSALYFGRTPTEEEQQIIFAYAALGGLLWSLWGVYKEKLGVQFTDYTIRMYRYFKEYSAKVPV